MAKEKRKLINFRAEARVVWAMEDLAERWRCNQTEAIVRAIMEAHGDSEASLPRRGGSNPASVPHERVAEVASLPFVGRCRHCPNEFRTGNKGATICPDCKSSGHTLSPSECPECNAGGAI